MNLKRKLALGGVALLIPGAALAQAQLGYKTFLGTETIEMTTGGPGGQSFYATVTQLRNTTGYQLLAAATGTIAPSAAVDNLLINTQPTGTTTINTPLNSSTLPLSDAQLFAVCNVTGSAWSTNTVTLAAAAGQTISGGSVTITTLAAHTCVEFQYVLSTTTWYQIR